MAHERRRPPPLTDDRQMERLADLRLGGHLALVHGRVARLPGADAQRPLVRALRVHRLEALVVGVRHDADGDDVQVMLAYPRDLRGDATTRDTQTPSAGY